MRISAKVGLTALVAALLLAAAVSTASARQLASSSQNIRVTWSRLEFEGRIGFGQTRCQVTLEGSFHSRTITKTIGALIGHITRVSVKTESCTNGRTTITRLPWHVTYEGFTGTLPSIVTVRLLLRDYRFIIERPAGLSPTCTYGTATDRLIGSVSLSSGVAGNLTPDAGNVSNLVEARNEEAFGRCPAQGELRGAATDGVVTVLGATTRVTITLI